MIVLELHNAAIKRNQLAIGNLSFRLMAGECLYITGQASSGKSTLLHALKNRIFFSSGTISGINPQETVLIEDRTQLRNKAGLSDFYYQQRFDAAFSNDCLTVIEELGDSARAYELLSEFGILQLANQHLIKLSNGENKKLQIIRALLKNPKLLLLDNPFAGLDQDSVKNLLGFFEKLNKNNIALLIACRPSLLPDNPGSVLELDKNIFHKNYEKIKQLPPELSLSAKRHNTGIPIVEFKDVNVRYDQRQILKDFSWKIFKGEKWLLKGPNGAGKSTILSLINADNPQAYSNNIYIFGKKRGTGESIWDLKKRIGFFSPELHLCFDLSMSAKAALNSAFTDGQISDSRHKLIDSMLIKLNIDANINLYELTFSQQRMILIGRALIKNPELLILDEPCQNLDGSQIDLVKSMVNDFTSTLIYVTHQQDEVPDSINAILEIRNGEITGTF